MKHSIQYLKKLLYLLICLTMCGFVSCSDDDDENLSKKIGIILYEPTNEFRTLVIDYAVKTATFLGYDYELKLPATAAEQEKELKAMADDDIEVIVFGDLGINPEVLNDIIDRGVKIVLYDGEVNCNYACFISGDNTGMGERGGEFFKDLTDVTKIVTLTVPSSTTISNARLNGFKSKLGEGKTLVEVPVSTQSESALLAVLDQILAADPDGVYTQDDIMAYALVNALEGKDHSIQAIFGGAAYQPFLRTIKANTCGITLGSATYSPEYVKQCVAVAAQILEGKEVEERRVVVTSELINLNNVDNYVKDNGNY